MTERLVLYEDVERTVVLEVRETFERRKDKLRERRVYLKKVRMGVRVEGDPGNKAQGSAGRKLGKSVQESSGCTGRRYSGGSGLKVISATGFRVVQAGSLGYRVQGSSGCTRRGCGCGDPGRGFRVQGGVAGPKDKLQERRVYCRKGIVSDQLFNWAIKKHPRYSQDKPSYAQDKYLPTHRPKPQTLLV